MLVLGSSYLIMFIMQMQGETMPEPKDILMIAATFLACLLGSGFGAWLTNRHDRKTESKRRNSERIRTVGNVLSEYEDILSQKKVSQLIEAAYLIDAKDRDEALLEMKIESFCERERRITSKLNGCFDYGDKKGTLSYTIENFVSDMALFRTLLLHPDRFIPVAASKIAQKGAMRFKRS